MKIHHEIIETDYDNYAIAYGCDNWFGGIIHTRWSSLLSRQAFIPHEYVTMAKTRMEDMNYDFNFWWIKSGLECGFDAAPTSDEIMITIFNTEPNWSNYEIGTSNTARAIGFFQDKGYDFPYGTIIDFVKYGNNQLESPLKNQIHESNF